MSNPSEKDFTRQKDPQRMWMPSSGFVTVCLILCLFTVVGLGLRIVAFHQPMIYDSKAFIADMVHKYAQHDVTQVIKIFSVRPVYMSVLYGLYRLFGMDPFYFRLFATLMLAAAGTALVVLIWLLLQTPAWGLKLTPRQGWAIAAAAGLYFVVHPAQTYVTLYIWQLNANYTHFLYLTAMALYVAVRLGRIERMVPAYALVSVLFIPAVLSKEPSMTLPVVLLLAEAALFPRDLRQLYRRACTIALITAPGFIAYAGTAVYYRILHYPTSEGLTIWQQVLTECRVAFQYTRLILAPPFDGVPLVRAEIISRSLWGPPETALAFVAIMTLWVGAALFIRRRPWIAFGVLFALITATPEAIMVPLYLFFGYRPVLPMVGLLVIVAVAAGKVLEREGTGTRARAAMVVVTSLLILWSATVSFRQAWRWDPVTLWADHYARLPEYSPDMERKAYTDVWTNYGGYLVEAKNYSEAISVLTKVVDLDPELARGHNTLGIALAKAGRLPEAAASFRKALELDPRSGIAYKGLGAVQAESGDLKGAIASYRMAVQFDPDIAENYVNLGVVLEESGNLPEAMECFRKAVASDPELAIARANLGHAFEKSGNMREAAQHYRAALQLDPESPQANYLVANILLREGQVDQAVLHYRKALKSKPDFLEARANLGLVMLRLNKVSEAIANLTDAIAADPGNVGLHIALGEAYAKKGDAGRAAELFKKALELDPANADAKSRLEQLPKPSRN